MSPTVLGLIVTIGLSCHLVHPMWTDMITSAHQTFLSYTSFQDWALNAPRISLVTANREGLSSLPGYFAIHLLGLGLGVLVLAPSPSYFRRAVSGKEDAEMIRPRDNGRLAMELGGWTVLWWTMLGLSLAFGPAGGVTRRLVSPQTLPKLRD
jgi:phosphatidylinositol glycan class W